MEDVGDPSRSAGGIGDESGAVVRGEAPAKFGNHRVIHGAFADPAEGEDDLGAFRVFSVHETRGYVTKDDFRFAVVDSSVRAGGQVASSHGDLIAESKDVGGMGTGGKHITTGFAEDEILHGIVTRTKLAELWMLFGNVVEAAPRTTDGAVFAVAGQRLVHGGARTKIKKILRSPDTFLGTRTYAFENGGGDGVSSFFDGRSRGLKY